MKAVVAAFNQEKALVGAFSVITNFWMDLFEALLKTQGTGIKADKLRDLEKMKKFCIIKSCDKYFPQTCFQKFSASWAEKFLSSKFNSVGLDLEKTFLFTVSLKLTLISPSPGNILIKQIKSIMEPLEQRSAGWSSAKLYKIIIC